MRSDYLFYLLAVVFFLIAATSIALVVDETGKILWATTAVILGLVSTGMGYYQRPKPTMNAKVTTEAKPAEPSPAPEQVDKPQETVAAPATAPSVPMEKAAAPPSPVPESAPAPIESPTPAVAETPAPVASELLSIKGINEKRAAQLKAAGINGISDLANASADDLAKKLTISPSIARMWIGSAKKLQKQPK